MTQTQDDTRTRTFGWTDPAEHAHLLGRRSGMEILRAMASGELPPPPVMHLIGGEGIHAEEGTVTLELEPQEFHYNPLGSVHGGILSTLLDTAAACSVHSTLPAGVGYTSMDLNVKFLRPATIASGRLTCTGTVLQRGRRTAFAEARITDGTGRLIAHATSSCMIFDLPAA
ncbi:PaaI family thioesterase [Actinoplanes utahensis]|uniref:Aromatic compound degradation protein PaaI n=1 Tax=Actinoplanes utahensis TaxID=1869 RepID=A0A0A6UD84_ACTUT|nr:PaaI family thioesterase [Actinoplanes utahensis]KHD73441.1 aromatic compound degradation protein PaaI [Actinoplanes utahensis]GIF30225.1 phenylacetic acid degradation protein [Actinoplanes utahensis]